MSKRVNILYFFSTMLLPLLIGCEQETSLTPLPDGEEPVEIRMSARVVDVSIETTRANTDFHTSLRGSTVGLYGLRGVGASFIDSIYMENRSLEYDSSNGALTSQTSKVYFPTGRDSAFLYAYCPYTAMTEQQNNDLCIRVKSSMSAMSDEAWSSIVDPLYAQTKSGIVRKKADETGSTPSGSAHFNFTHRMARLQVLVKTDANTENYRLQKVAITFANHQHGYLNLRTGDITTANTASETYTETFDDVLNSSIANPQLDYSALPAKGAVTKIVLTIKMDNTADMEGEEYTVFESDGSHSIDLESGKTTKVIINFNPNTNVSASLNNTWETTEVPINYNK